jgi:hypothetical protein
MSPGSWLLAMRSPSPIQSITTHATLNYRHPQ